MPDRTVRFTDSFFDRLDSLFAAERGADGSPSATDVLLSDMPRVRDRLADDFEGNTLATDDPDIRVYIGSGVLVPTLAVIRGLHRRCGRRHLDLRPLGLMTRPPARRASFLGRPQLVVIADEADRGQTGR